MTASSSPDRMSCRAGAGSFGPTRGQVPGSTGEAGLRRALHARLRRRLAVALLAGVLLLYGGLFARLVYVHTTLSPELLDRAERRREASSVIPARRGMILDRRGRVVATSEQQPDVFVDPALIRDPGSLAAALGPPLNRPPEEIVQRIEARPDSRFVVVAETVDAVTAEAVRSLNLVGVGLSERPIRKYPLLDSMAQVVGWVGRDGKGMEGIELQLDEHLAGKDGRRSAITDARRRALHRSESGVVLPEDGGHVVLTIDAEVQRIVEEAVQEALVRLRAESGVGIVMDPHTGDIFAMASLPVFDPNHAPSTPAGLRRNRAVTDPVEPGSTFKPFLACGALDGGHVSRTERIDCHMGRYRFGRRPVTDTKPHGLLDLRGIIAHSSNIGMGKIAERMGNPVLHATVRRFGFGERTGVQFPGEGSGVVYPLSKWGELSTQSVAMGYEVLVTPLQLARAFSAIVNNGVLLRPRLVRQLLDPTGHVLRSFEGPEPIGRAVSAETARYMVREPLLAVVEESGRIRSDRYTILGKTGTAKLLHPELPRYDEGAYLGTFVGAAPASRPELVALVMIRRPDPSLGYYGSATAAPAAATILDRSLAYLGVSPDKPTARTVAARDR